jgi:hypothetical protein
MVNHLDGHRSHITLEQLQHLLIGIAILILVIKLKVDGKEFGKMNKLFHML